MAFTALARVKTRVRTTKRNSCNTTGRGHFILHMCENQPGVTKVFDLKEQM